MTSPVAPALDPAVQKLRNVRDLASLVAYLHEELDWPVAEYDFEDLVYDVTPQEAGLDPATAAKVRSIKRLRPLSNDQPWGIFFIDFVPGNLPITVLRRILRAVSIKKREVGRADRKAWQTDDLLFISVLGEEGDRDLNLAHFNEDPAGKRATLRVVEWDADDTAFAILRTRDELKNLAWRRDGETDELWRERWSKAFALRPREVAQTAKALASQMAQLAKLIRERVNEAIKVESEAGPLRELRTAFREVLLHDLTEDGFADMYAQTITYGLFAARYSRPMGITLDNAVDMIPNTNPFLRDLLAQFTTASGLTHALDFDELGVDALVDALNQANIEAVVADFGRSKPGEDPVIHFYEDFLREYNKKQKLQRGVFYTPRPVVSFIVRSVHELLQTEFQLPDGLASTDTWGDLVAKFPDLKVPEGADAGTPFVQVLDPACGTGTFLVEVIQLIHDTMTAKWAKEGIKHGSFEWQQAWNDYVPKHLLTRVYGFELMMASYTIAHMKVGLKLGELGYKFAAAERLRIYLTNTLEPPQDFRGMFDIMAPALAHEAHAVNEVKRATRLTVVIGNPPYSIHSGNLSSSARQLVDRYRVFGGKSIIERGALQFEKNIQNDYVKFHRYAELQVLASQVGVVGLITSSAFMGNRTLRGMRESLLETYEYLAVVDLHGNSASGEGRALAADDENVFDITEGVAVSFFVRGPAIRPLPRAVSLGELAGAREFKYQRLGSCAWTTYPWNATTPQPPFLSFRAVSAAATGFYSWPALDELYNQHSAGIITARDDFATDFEKAALEDRMDRFAASPASGGALRAEFSIRDKRGWDVDAARAKLRRETRPRACVQAYTYRPFDKRFIAYNPGVVWGMAYPTLRHTLQGDNVVLAAMQQYQYDVPEYCYALCTDGLTDSRVFVSKTGVAALFPVYLGDDGGLGPRRPNTPEPWLQRFLSFLPDQAPPDPATVAIELASYVYAVLHSGTYRRSFETELRTSFPRIPMSGAPRLVQELSRCGSRLIDLHLLRVAPEVEARYEGSRGPIVGRHVYDPTAMVVAINGSDRFSGVNPEVWSWYVGGYQPSQKWLKDRRGRVLTDEDIEHYKRIIGAIEETIRIQKEIDEVIDAHGGWPAAFQGGESSS